MRPIMTRAELQAHFVTAFGRDYSRSDDGYSDMEVAATEGWRAIAGWGRDDFTTTVTEIEAAPFGGGTYEIACTCGERVRYSGQAFTEVEARRHQAWHAKQAS